MSQNHFMQSLSTVRYVVWSESGFSGGMAGKQVVLDICVESEDEARIIGTNHEFREDLISTFSKLWSLPNVHAFVLHDSELDELDELDEPNHPNQPSQPSQPNALHTKNRRENPKESGKLPVESQSHLRIVQPNKRNHED